MVVIIVECWVNMTQAVLSSGLSMGVYVCLNTGVVRLGLCNSWKKGLFHRSQTHVLLSKYRRYITELSDYNKGSLSVLNQSYTVFIETVLYAYNNLHVPWRRPQTDWRNWARMTSNPAHNPWCPSSLVRRWARVCRDWSVSLSVTAVAHMESWGKRKPRWHNK